MAAKLFVATLVVLALVALLAPVAEGASLTDEQTYLQLRTWLEVHAAIPADAPKVRAIQASARWISLNAEYGSGRK